MKGIEVTFYKEVKNFWGDIRYEKEQFIHPIDCTKEYCEEVYNAYDEAVRRGHKPTKHIRFRVID